MTSLSGVCTLPWTEPAAFKQAVRQATSQASRGGRVSGKSQLSPPPPSVVFERDAGAACVTRINRGFPQVNDQGSDLRHRVLTDLISLYPDTNRQPQVQGLLYLLQPHNHSIKTSCFILLHDKFLTSQILVRFFVFKPVEHHWILHCGKWYQQNFIDYKCFSIEICGFVYKVSVKINKKVFKTFKRNTELELSY